MKLLERRRNESQGFVKRRNESQGFVKRRNESQGFVKRRNESQRGGELRELLHDVVHERDLLWRAGLLPHNDPHHHRWWLCGLCCLCGRRDCAAGCLSDSIQNYDLTDMRAC
jgi:hypothetical protein